MDSLKNSIFNDYIYIYIYIYVSKVCVRDSCSCKYKPEEYHIIELSGYSKNISESRIENKYITNSSGWNLFYSFPLYKKD